ncbi:MAG: T9SS type A sorting domain-containing protein [Agriterribacter sp.]
MQNTQKPVYTRISSNVGGYLESLPIDYSKNPTQKYPLIIFMHGVGERGNGSASLLPKVANVGIAKMLRVGQFPAYHTYGGKTYSFIVISPQFEKSSGWVTDIQAIIDYAKKTYRVDEQRIYLTGLSLGGIMGWSYAAGSVAHGQTLAATLLITPGATATAAQLKNVSASQLPVWVTNNNGDPYNPASQATALVNAINSTVPAPPKALLTIFTAVGHDAWSATYNPTFKQNGLNVYEWMLSKSRGSSSGANPPVLTANAGSNQVITLPTNSVTLDASASKVTSGSITSYAWAKLSGPAAGTITLVSNGLQAKVTGLTAGTYQYQLTVKDSNGSTATATVTVTVNSAASTDPPTVNAGAGGTITLPTNTFTLDGSASKASTGNTIVSYKWTKSTTSPSGGAITSPTSVKTTVTGLIAGTYVYSLLVTDNKGQSRSGGTTIIVKPASGSSTPPTANAGYGGIFTLPFASFELDGFLSKAATGNTLVSYLWTKATSSPAGGDIATPNSVKTLISNFKVGTYTYTLKVTDNKGASSSASVIVIIKEGTSVPPTANAGYGGIFTLPFASFELDGFLSKAATGNTLVSYLWTKASSSPAGGDIATPNSMKTLISNFKVGMYTYILKVTDNKGASSSANVIVIIKEAESAPPTANAGYGGIFTLPFSSFELNGFLSKAAAGNTLVSYLWTKASSSPAGGDIATPNSMKTLISNFKVGMYTYILKVTDNKGASSSANVIVDIKAATATRNADGASANVAQSDATALSTDLLNQNQLEGVDVTITPNPVVSDMNVLVKGNAKGNTNLIVYSMDGKPLQQQSFLKDGTGSLNKNFNLSRYPAGIYVVQVIVDGKYKKSMRVVKR